MSHGYVLLVLHHAPDRSVILAKTEDYLFGGRLSRWGADLSRWPSSFGQRFNEALSAEMPAYGIFVVRVSSENGPEVDGWDFRIWTRHLSETEQSRLLDGKPVWGQGDFPLREDLWEAPPWLSARSSQPSA